ncbi:uridine kinase [Streptomyces sp. N35]|uniref:uridine kinase family protein n=1 Tax=Streptomyces sp. N35 TaxID=2795730 RepID=UPI0018F30A3C|nr:zeta toxin family protein [Streptomyces sp. N35]
MDDRTTPALLALAGGAGSGKTTLATRLADRTPGGVVVHLDHYFHTDPTMAPSVPSFDTPTRQVVDYSDPRAIDTGRLQQILDRTTTASLLIVEGTFALALPLVRHRARWSAYIEMPADLRLALKVLRKFEEGDPRTSLRGYLARGRDAHEAHVRPTKQYADLVIDGTRPLEEQLGQLGGLVGQSSRTGDHPQWA